MSESEGQNSELLRSRTPQEYLQGIIIDRERVVRGELSIEAFGQGFISSLGGVVEGGLHQQPKVRELLEAFGKTGAVWQPMLQQLLEARGRSGEAQGRDEFLELVQLAEVLGMDRDTSKPKIVELIGQFKQDREALFSRSQRSGVQHQWASPHGEKAQATIPVKPDAQIGSIDRDQMYQIGSSLGISKDKLDDETLYSNLENPDRLPYPLGSERANQVAEQTLTPEGLAEYRRISMDNVLNRLQAAVEDNPPQTGWRDPRDVALRELRDEERNILDDPKLREYFINKLFDLSSEARDLASHDLTGAEGEGVKFFVEEFRKELNRRGDEIPEWLNRYDEYAKNDNLPNETVIPEQSEEIVPEPQSSEPGTISLDELTELAKAGKIEDAAEGYRSLLRAQPESAEEVTKVVTTLLESNPNNSSLYRALGDAHIRAGRFQKAIEAYSKAVNSGQSI